MLLGTLLSVAVAGSAVIATAAMTTKEKDKIIQPTTINNNINNSINNSFNNSFNSHTQQSAEIDHDKIIDELYMKYKIDKNVDDLNELLEKLNNLK